MMHCDLLGRIHSAEQAVEAFGLIRSAGFDNINIDLIQSIPGMAPPDIAADVRKAIELGPEHISYYNLIYEPGTPLALDLDAGRIETPDDDEEADNYYDVKAALETGGYRHYEISNFSRSGRECQHNILYWQGGEYFGCGPAAHSHWNGKRFGNIEDLSEWCSRVDSGRHPFDETEELKREGKGKGDACDVAAHDRWRM